MVLLRLLLHNVGVVVRHHLVAVRLRDPAHPLPSLERLLVAAHHRGASLRVAIVRGLVHWVALVLVLRVGRRLVDMLRPRVLRLLAREANEVLLCHVVLRHVLRLGPVVLARHHHLGVALSAVERWLLVRGLCVAQRRLRLRLGLGVGLVGRRRGLSVRVLRPDGKFEHLGIGELKNCPLDGEDELGVNHRCGLRAAAVDFLLGKAELLTGAALAVLQNLVDTRGLAEHHPHVLGKVLVRNP